MASGTLIAGPDDHPSSLSVVGIEIAVLTSKDEANGREITLQTGAEGMGPPPHHHDWDESLYEPSGAVLFMCDSKTTVCKTGTLVHIPANTSHAFSFMDGGGQMLEITERGRAVELFRALDREVPPGPPDVQHLVGVLAGVGVTVPPPEQT